MEPNDKQLELSAQYRTLLQTSTDGFFVNVGGRFVYVNPAFQRLVGALSPEELLGRKVFDFIDQRSHEAVRARIEAIRTSSDPVAPLEERYVRLDGSFVDVEVTAVAVVEGGQHAILVTVRDISERKAAERARRQLEDQLRQSQKMEALGTLAGGIAHDFNNILAAIAANAELARRRVPAEHAVQRYVDEIVMATSRATGLTRQILAFSKRQPARLDAIDLRRTVEEALSLVSAAAPFGISVEADLGSNALPVLADATQMHQVLLNLCSNAWQSFEGRSGDGRSGRIRVGLERCEQSGRGSQPADLAAGAYAVLSVEDDGPGIDPAIVERIFDPFFTTKEPGAGTGLGLSVVHGIAKSHGARIVCEQRAPHGTVFRLFIPVVADVQQRSAPRPQGVTPGSGEHILLVDDEVVLVEVTADLLQTHGYRVSGFTRPVDALAAVNADVHAFDVVVTDLKMPGQSGLDVARGLRTIAPDIPVILLSGFLADDVRGEAEALGISQILEKPASVGALSAAIAHVLAHRRSVSA